MKPLKKILYLLLGVAFITGCETESIQTNEDSNLRLFESVTTPEKQAALESIKEHAFNSRFHIPLGGQLCPGEVASGEVEIGSRLTFPVGAEFWYFEAEAGDVMSFEVNRTNCNADPLLILWYVTDLNELIYIGEIDDEDEPACTPDCFAFGDPYISGVPMPFTGVYTVGVVEWGFAECLDESDTGTYDILLTGQNTCVINIDGCDTGVANRFVGDSNMDEMLDALEAGDYRNHGQFVRTVAQLVNSWYNAGLITLAEKDAIMECAGMANIPS